MRIKRVLGIVLALVMLFSVIPLGKAVYAADEATFDVSGSKKAEPTELDSDHPETTVTLSLPSAEYQNQIDIVFVMDNSTSIQNAGLDLSDYATDLFDSILENNDNIDLKVGVVKFRGYATDMLGNGLVSYSDDTKTMISDAISNTAVPGRGSNVHSGMVMADQLLSADEDVDDSHKYVILLADGKAYIWNDENNRPVQFYSVYLRNGALQQNGLPFYNQLSGIYNKENTSPIYHSVPYDTDAAFPVFLDYNLSPLSENGKTSAYYQRLFDSDNAELTDPTPYDHESYYSQYPGYNGKSPDAGTAANVTKIDPANRNTVFSISNTVYKSYYKYEPTEGSGWEDLKYLTINPYHLKQDEETGEWLFNTDDPDEDFFLLHATGMEKASYIAGHYWKEVIDAKYNTAAIIADPSSYTQGTFLSASFARWLQENSDNGAFNNNADQVVDLFTQIDNSIRYMVSKGVVTDKITDEFTLKNADNKDGFSMTFNNEALTVSYDETEGKWNFGEAVDGVYPYVVEFDADTKTITWTINVPIENLKPVTLSYVLTIDVESASDFYDTNVSAVLDYKSTDGKRDGSFTFEVPKVSYINLIDINVEKKWEDADDQDGKRAASITANLMDGDTKVQSLVLSDRNKWTATFESVPDSKIVDGKIQAITYTVEEEDVEGYKAGITGNVSGGFVITNTHEPEKTDITVEKVWEDDDDKLEIRPDSVTVTLFADGEKVDSKQITEADGWKITFDGLDKYKAGKEITYTVTEDEVEGYETSIEGFVVTNAVIPPVEYTITYKLNGGVFDGKTDDILEVYPADTVISIHEAPTREGYKFLYWEGSSYQPGDSYTVTEDHTFTAQWEPDVPKTGDNSNILLWSAALAVSALGIAVLAVTSRKRKPAK